MTAPSTTRLRIRLVACLASLVFITSFGACRKSPKTNANANSSTTNGSNDPEQAKRQAQSLIQEGKELYKNDQDEQAVEKFKQAINQDPNNAEAHLRLGMSYAALDNKDESETEYKKAIELFKKRNLADAKDAGAFFLLGEAHSFLHQDEDAVRAYKQATKLKPDDEEAWYRLGMAETRLAQYPEAISAFQKALELDPNDSRATDGLENAQEGAQRIKEGKKHAEDMLKKQQENANANANGNSNTSSNSKGKPTPKHTPARKP
jgi:tetratricopeptide (TPR) repeat protein